MSEARTDTTQQRPTGADEGSGTGGSGKHRGGASAENTSVQPHGRHRRPAEEESRAA
ncbi:hypothetical protein [Streptomyces sp. MW-W600-10]|uniref:hypothetical protein n=1 Tax=Streptomyces TaxID=1883 RepID=UPI001C47F8E0|nr:hypothetical protein [Streptomyces sp. MW-W600-10]MBV7248627.1 hypothetical protein [Streptomyces sp. MW-W600-10]